MAYRCVGTDSSYVALTLHRQNPSTANVGFKTSRVRFIEDEYGRLLECCTVKSGKISTDVSEVVAD